jgi:putative aldouronate transport system substrate-binding protein
MKKKILSMLLSMVLTVACFTGCGSNPSSGGETGGTASAEIPQNPEDMYTVTMAVIGNDQEDMDLVEAEMNKILAEKVGAQIDVITLGWGVYQQQLQLLSIAEARIHTGRDGRVVDSFIVVDDGSDPNFEQEFAHFQEILAEKLDLVPIMYNNVSTYVNSGQVLDMSDLIDQYGVNMKAALGEDILKIANMNGYVYGVPVEKEWYADSCLVMRKDILDKYNLDVSNVKSLADCAPIFETIHENEPDMKILVGAKDGLIGNIYFADVLSDRFGVLDNGGADTTIVNYYETDNYKNLAATVHDYYEKGYIDKDMATSTDAGTTILKAGNAFCFATPYKPGVAEQESLNTGYELVAVRINPTPAFCYTNAVAAITWGIGQNCENPEMTMKVLDYMYGDPELMNLFNWGIEGVHYVVKDAENDVIGFPDGVDASNAKYNLNMGWELPNQYKIHVWEGSSRKIMDAQKEMNTTANKSKALGFMFDSTSVSNEIAALNNVVSEYSASIDCGAADPTTAIPEFNEKLYAAGLQTVMDEKQKQLNEWLENQK